MTFFLADVPSGTDAVDETGVAAISGQTLLSPGSYSVAAVYASGDTQIAGSQDASSLLIVPEEAIVVPKPGNPDVIAAPGGVFSGTMGPFCFDITEVPDGSAGDSSLITEIDPSLEGFVGSVQFSGFTRTGGGAQPRTICYKTTVSGATAGEYAARATLSDGEHYSGSGASPFRIADPRTLSADLLVGLGIDKLNVKQGDLLTYTITVRNFGPDPAFNAVVNDTLSSGSTFISAVPNRGRYTAPAVGQTGVVTWYLGDLANGSDESAQITVTVIVKGPTTITNTATVSLDNADPNPTNNTATIASNVDKAGGGGKKKP